MVVIPEPPGKGRPSLIARSGTGSTRQTTVLSWTAGGELTAAPPLTHPSLCYFLSGDVNGDGRGDVVKSCANTELSYALAPVEGPVALQGFQTIAGVDPA